MKEGGREALGELDVVCGGVCKCTRHHNNVTHPCPTPSQIRPLPHAVLHVALPVHDINHALGIRVALVGVVGWAIVQLLTAEAWSKGV